MNYSEEDKHPHRVHTEYSEKIYWTQAKDEGYLVAGNITNCTSVELRSRYGTYPSFTFDMPLQKHELEKMERLMFECYKRGQIDRGVAIGEMMKGLIDL